MKDAERGDAGHTPPLGVKPRWLVEEERMEELADALVRYTCSYGPNVSPAWRSSPSVVAAWLDEMRDIVARYGPPE